MAGFLSPMFQKIMELKAYKDSLMGTAPNNPQTSQVSMPMAQFSANEWLGQQPMGFTPQQQPMPQQNSALNTAEAIGSIPGSVKKGVFDFVGVSPEAQDWMKQNSANRQPMPQQQPMQSPQAQTRSNLSVVEMYKQMMNSIKQKRGF